MARYLSVVLHWEGSVSPVDPATCVMVLVSDPGRQGKVRPSRVRSATAFGGPLQAVLVCLHTAPSHSPRSSSVSDATTLSPSPAGLLPTHLAERIIGPNPAPPPGEGSKSRHAVGSGSYEAMEGSGNRTFILYWMRTAVRGHENPALDVALELGRREGLPVFVYHALDERYPYASDRHHTFILEGARDVEDELARRGIGYAFHLARPGHRGPHLITLARQAAAVVTEEMPVPFLRSWVRKLREATGTPVWTVDADCIVPLPFTRGRETDRAFRFRSATEKLRRERLPRPWNDALPPTGAPKDPWLPEDLPFEPVKLATADLAALVAACRIDHSVAPVPHTRGGSRAGYARWNAFREAGLRSYNRRRNDPLADGVSRLSPYLHFGHVSPFRIAREAHDEGGPGAEKFLDELMVWRELSHAFCFHRSDPDDVAALPDWARETLARHRDDPRPVIHTLETLERGRTGSGLWDAAQRSLLIHGELHNNVRMTWGKALLSWTHDAGQALARLLELNDRYALDGRDPNSRGGILWCLGAFDRPFDPPRPILGRVRGREVEGHARRLDVEAYARRTGRPALEPAPRVAVVGAGMAGLTAARTLTDHGLHVRVFDKGRHPGGRMATRESRQGWLADHGAQFFTARDPRFARHLPSWVEAGVVARWEGKIVRVTRGKDGDTGPLTVETARDSVRWVGTPGMRALPTHLARDLDVATGIRVMELVEDGPRWFLQVQDEGTPGQLREEGPFDAVILTPPPPQTAQLLEVAAPELAGRVSPVPVAPCWAAIVEVAGRVTLPFDGAFLPGPVLSWICRDSARPGRPGAEGLAPDAPPAGDSREWPSPTSERWVLHADPAWSREHLELERDEASTLLVDAFRELTGALGVPVPEEGQIVDAVGHRWRYALPESVEEPYLWDPERGIGVAGDAWGGPRVEGAFLSGQAVAGRLLGDPPRRGRGKRTSEGAGAHHPDHAGEASDAQGSLFHDGE